MAEIRAVLGNASPILGGQHLRHNGMMPGRPLLTEPVLSPILTDTEVSPLHRTGIGSAPGTYRNCPEIVLKLSGNCTEIVHEIVSMIVSGIVHNIATKLSPAFSPELSP